MKKITSMLVLACLCAAIFSSCVSSRSAGCPTTDKNFFKSR